jgi:hypothetical protein
MGTLRKLQSKRISFDIVTTASEPLTLDDYTIEQLRQALDRAAREVIDLRYYPDGDRYNEQHHSFVGVLGVQA